MVVVKINDKILLYIFGYFGLYTFGSCIPLGLVYLWVLYTFGLYTFGFVYLWVIYHYFSALFLHPRLVRVTPRNS